MYLQAFVNYFVGGLIDLFVVLVLEQSEASVAVPDLLDENLFLQIIKVLFYEIW